MKTFLSSLAVLSTILFSVITANAQQWMIGLRAGTNLANETNNTDLLPNYTYAIRPGFLGGGQVDYWFDKMWAISADVLFDQKGVIQSVNEDPGTPGALTGTFHVVLNYLEIPILLKASFGISNFRPYVFAGPSFGMFLSGSNTANWSNPNTPYNGKMTIPDSAVKSTDIAAVLGAGVSLMLGSGQMVFVDASYAYGLVNINNLNDPSNETINSRDIRIAAGILFPLD
jgi:hypothetical protein